MFTDLHIHTKCSDGKFSIADTIQIAKDNNIKLLSVTDHDSVSGVSEAIQISQSYDMTCISGLELSCRNENSKILFPQDISIHILSYNFDYKSSFLLDYLKKYHFRRKQILLELIEELTNNGFEIKFEDISVIAGTQMRIQDIINHINSSFACKQRKKQLIEIADSFYPRLFLQDCTLNEAINIIKCSGGIPVLAHAFFSYRDYDIINNTQQDVSSLIDYLCDIGIEGIEVFYSRFNKSQVEWLLKKATSKNMMITAGSDFHGTPSRNTMINYEINQLNKTIKKLLVTNRYSG